jgi:hypothetical protein
MSLIQCIARLDTLLHHCQVEFCFPFEKCDGFWGFGSPRQKSLIKKLLRLRWVLLMDKAFYQTVRIEPGSKSENGNWRL